MYAFRTFISYQIDFVQAWSMFQTPASPRMKQKSEIRANCKNYWKLCLICRGTAFISATTYKPDFQYELQLLWKGAWGGMKSLYVYRKAKHKTINFLYLCNVATSSESTHTCLPVKLQFMCEQRKYFNQIDGWCLLKEKKWKRKIAYFSTCRNS